MSQFIEVLKAIAKFCSNQWKRGLVIFALAIVLIPVLFPLSDLRSVVATKLSSQIAMLLYGQDSGFALDFKKLNWLIPVGIELNDVEVDLNGFPPLAAQNLKISPHPLSVFSHNFNGSVDADGVFGGSAHIHINPLSRGKTAGFEVGVDLSELSLNHIMKALSAAGIGSLNLNGKITSSVNGALDPSFTEQPDMNIELHGQDIKVPDATIPIPNMGPLQTPGFQFAKVLLKSELKSGKLQIEQLTLGEPQNALFGKISGEVDMKLQKQSGDTAVHPVLGGFNLKVELGFSKSMFETVSKSGLGLGLLMIDKFKKEEKDTTKFSFRVSSPQFGVPPKFDAL